MKTENLEEIIKILSKGNTSPAEKLLSKPGGRKYIESIVLIIISNLHVLQEEKEDVFQAFLHLLNMLENRIKHQKNGQAILNRIDFWK